MKISLPIAGLLLGVWVLPVTGFAASSSGAPVPAASSNETPGPGAVKPVDNSAKSKRRSDHPVDDSVITTKIKAKFVKDKQVRTDNIEIKTVNGAVELTGTARTKTKARHAVSLARQVKGVKSVKNDIQITPAEPVAAGDRTYQNDRAASRSGSGQPVSDSWITTKVKSKLGADKQVKGSNINVTTVNGVVQLSGFAGSTSEASKAASLAGGIKGVKSVTNDIKVN